MKKTRDIFVLTGSKQDVNTALESLQFKGTTILTDESLSKQKISEVFANNKSVICTKTPICNVSPIIIEVINSKMTANNDDFINIDLGNIVKQFESIADRHNCDIGDHKSNSSGLNGSPSTKNCAYCSYLLNESSHPQKTIYSSEHFFAITTLGSFIPGYWLIIPFKHVMSNAELDYSTQKELLTVIEDLTYLLKLTYNNCECLVWENGTGNSGIGKAKDSIVHAHTHIVPSTLTAEKIKDLSGFHFEKISTEELSKYNLHSYLLIKDSANTWRVSSNPEAYIPRQYVRQLIADEYDIPGEQWNWRIYPFEEQMIQSYYDMAESIRKNWDSLPARIKENTHV